MMEFHYTPASIASIIKGKLVATGHEHTIIREFLIDSRKLITPGECLFIALVSKRNDGHNYIPELYEKGVRCFLVSRLPVPDSGPPGSFNEMDAAFIIADDTLTAIDRKSTRLNS